MNALIPYRAEVQMLTGVCRSMREYQLIYDAFNVDYSIETTAQYIFAHRINVRIGSITTPNAGERRDYYPVEAMRKALIRFNRERAEALRHTIRRPGAPFFEHAVRIARQLRAPESYTQPRRGKTKAEWDQELMRKVTKAAMGGFDPFASPHIYPGFGCAIRPIISDAGQTSPGVQVMDEGFIRAWISKAAKASQPKTLVEILKELGCEEFHMQADYAYGTYYVWCDPQYHLPAAAEFEKHRAVGTQVVFSRFDRPIRALSKQITSDAETKTNLQEQRDATNKRARELANNLEAANKALQGFSAQLSDARRLLESAEATSLKHSERVEVLQAQRDAAYKALDDVKTFFQRWGGRTNPFRNPLEAYHALADILTSNGIH
jgi:hypothetical protein